MPNPLVRRMTPQSKTNVDRPVAETPIPESIHGHVFPYRGMEQHGVAPTEDDRTLPADYWDERRGVEIEYEPDRPAPDPIPVYVVNSGGRELRRLRVFRAYATGSASPVGGARNVVNSDAISGTRRRVKIKNLDTTTVYIGDEANTASAMHGWPLAQNEVYETDSQEDLWALGTGTADSPLAVAVEYAVIVNG